LAATVVLAQYRRGQLQAASSGTRQLFADNSGLCGQQPVSSLSSRTDVQPPVDHRRLSLGIAPASRYDLLRPGARTSRLLRDRASHGCMIVVSSATIRASEIIISFWICTQPTLTFPFEPEAGYYFRARASWPFASWALGRLAARADLGQSDEIHIF